MKKNLIKLSLLAVLFSSCAKDPEVANPVVLPTEDLFKSGLYFVNEGNFNTGNATIDYFSKDSNKVYTDIFKTVNGRDLGDVAQSMTIHNYKGYIVLNGSAKVEVIDAKNAKSIATIEGFLSPRFMVALDSTKGYVSDWFSNTVKEINLKTNAISKSINVGEGPEGMLIVGSNLYVANCGGYGLDSTISIINLNTNEERKLIVGDAPVAIQKDANGNIWVLCRGSYGPSWQTIEDDTKGELVKINPSTNQIIARYPIGNKGDHPDKMKINAARNSIYFLSSYNQLSGLFKFNITDVAVLNSPFIQGSFYGVGVDRTNDEVYIASSPSFSQKGFMLRYNSSGTLIKSYDVGFIPNGISEQ